MKYVHSALSVALLVSQIYAQETPPFDGCDVETYYASLLGASSNVAQWARSDLELLVTETHRNELPMNGELLGDDDIFQAIIDLDMSPEPNSTDVLLVYRDQPMNATPNGNPFVWDREYLWPLQRGILEESPAFTDIMHLKPAKATILMKKGLLSFGMCDTVEYELDCVRPANSEAAEDTAYDGKIWQPPARWRGDIARSLMYMDLRYEELTLQDCGPFENAMGYLSQLLEWHEQDPPDEFEIRRNDRACTRWQGNRNPFIDYPGLAQALHGPPQQILNGTRTYPSCLDIPTPAPTATPNDCNMIRNGNVPFFLVNSDDPDEVIFLPLQELPGELDLYLTDKAWNGNDLIEDVPDDGTVMMTTPPGGIGQGESFGYGPQAPFADQWVVESGTFNLGPDGDNIFLYCRDANDQIKFLAGYSNFGDWKVPNLADAAYGEGTSALPQQLMNAHVTLEPMRNYFYNGSRTATIPALREDIRNADAWVGDDLGRFQLGDGSDTSDELSTHRTVLSLLASLTGVLTTLWL